jgi:hypothetical protein
MTLYEECPIALLSSILSALQSSAKLPRFPPHVALRISTPLTGRKDVYIGRIPKGGKSADLPIVRATKFALVTTLQAERFLKARHKKISHSIVVRRIPALQDRQRTWRTTHALQKADK